MLAALECGAGLKPFSAWVEKSESFANRKSEKLEAHLKLAYGLIEDILRVTQRQPAMRHRDIQPQIAAISERVTFAWIEQAVRYVDELVQMVRRNIQKTAALDAFVVNLRAAEK